MSIPIQRTRESREIRAKQCCHAWLQALEQTTSVLRRTTTSRTTTDRASLEEIDRSIQYLAQLEKAMNKVGQYWDYPPLRMPPRNHRQSKSSSNSSSALGAMNNPLLASEEDSLIVMRRIQIRIVTSESEVFALKATQYRYANPPQWRLGADTYVESLEKIHLALDIADSEYAKLMFQDDDDDDDDDDAGDYNYDNNNKNGDSKTQLDKRRMMMWLKEDANIVEVAVRYLTDELLKFRKAAAKQAERLQQKLIPQWTSRDEVRAKMGDERWENNPAPKNDHAKLRRNDEAILKDIQAALTKLDSMKLPDPSLSDRYAKPENRTAGANANQRYNGKRPTNLSRRVPFQEYPDPTIMGWTFTGSWNNYVEFFEKLCDNNNNNDDSVVVKLDWYFTTATVKTSLNHPAQGKTQLFGSKVTPEVFVEILKDPRVHTNIRYQTKGNKHHS